MEFTELLRHFTLTLKSPLPLKHLNNNVAVFLMTRKKSQNELTSLFMCAFALKYDGDTGHPRRMKLGTK